jgi:hypothetical protein
MLLHYTAAKMWYCHTAHGAAGGGAGWKHHAYDIGDYPLPPAYRAPTKKVISNSPWSLRSKGNTT